MIYFILFLFDYNCREICRRSRRPGVLGRGRICDPVTVGRAVGNVTTFSIRFFPSDLSCPSGKVVLVKCVTSDGTFSFGK